MWKLASQSLAIGRTLANASYSLMRTNLSEGKNAPMSRLQSDASTKFFSFSSTYRLLVLIQPLIGFSLSTRILSMSHPVPNILSSALCTWSRPSLGSVYLVMSATFLHERARVPAPLCSLVRQPPRPSTSPRRLHKAPPIPPPQGPLAPPGPAPCGPSSCPLYPRHFESRRKKKKKANAADAFTVSLSP